MVQVLEVACGTGRNLIAAARRYPQARFFGFDISTAMLETAEKSIGRAGLADRIRIAPGDATAFSGERPFGTAAFDRIFISYALSMIPDWEGTIPAALAALAPGGSLHIVDFGQQERLPRWFRTLLRGWLAKFHVEPRAQLEDVLRREAAAAGRPLRFEPLTNSLSGVPMFSPPVMRSRSAPVSASSSRHSSYARWTSGT